MYQEKNGQSSGTKIAAKERKDHKEILDAGIHLKRSGNPM
jgi:hypothetical protein